MSYWELRQIMEQAIPWWVPFAIPVLIGMAWSAYTFWKRG